MVKRLKDIAVRARLIAEIAPFNTWPDAAVRRLAERSSVASFAAGAHIINPDVPLDHLVVIVDGCVQAGVEEPMGGRFVFSLFQPSGNSGTGRAFGLVALADPGVPLNGLAAHTETIGISIPFADIRHELQRAPGLWHSIARELAVRSRSWIGSQIQQIFEPVALRLARILVRFADLHGRPTAIGIEIDLRLSQESLADMLGVSRQTVTELVKQLTDANLIEWSYRRVTIINRNGLSELFHNGRKRSD